MRNKATPPALGARAATVDPCLGARPAPPTTAAPEQQLPQPELLAITGRVLGIDRRHRFGLDADKDQARRRAIETLADVGRGLRVARQRDHGRADSDRGLRAAIAAGGGK